MSEFLERKQWEDEWLGTRLSATLMWEIAPGCHGKGWGRLALATSCAPRPASVALSAPDFGPYAGCHRDVLTHIDFSPLPTRCHLISLFTRTYMKASPLEPASPWEAEMSLSKVWKERGERSEGAKAETSAFTGSSSLGKARFINLKRH